jgi:uncharacterized protein YqeY
MLRDRLKNDVIAAMKAREELKLSTLRMAQAALKNKDIELRTGTAPADDDLVVIDVLSKMVKQRRDTVAEYEKYGRTEKAAAEQAEIAILEAYLPKQMGAEEAAAVIKALVAEIGATSPKDMGKVMAALKERYAGQLDLGAAGPLVKAALAGST